MLLPKKTEIIEILSALTANRISRIEASNWAKPIAKQFPMNIASFKDDILDQAFIAIQISDEKLSSVSPDYYPECSEYYVSGDDLRYWLEILKDAFVPKVSLVARLQDLHPQKRLKFADFHDLIWHISPEEFGSLTGLMPHSSMSDLYYERYAYFVADGMYHILITWDMAYGVKKGVVYSNIGESAKTLNLLVDIFGSEHRFSDQTMHH